MNVTSYKLGDRFKELSSYAGIAVVMLTTALPQFLTAAELIHVMAPIGAVLGGLLFFLPENRSVLTLEHIFAAIEARLPTAYRVPSSEAPSEPDKPTPPASPSVASRIANSGSIVPMIAMLTLVAFGLAACGAHGQLTPKAKQALSLACQIDGAVQPIGAATLSTLVPQTSGAVSVDQMAVHPAIVKFCATLGGKPVAAAVATTAPAAAATAPTAAASPPAPTPSAAPTASGAPSATAPPTH